MITGIQPAEAGDKPVYTLTYLSLSCSLASLVGQTSFSVFAQFKNTGSDTFKGYANIGVINESGRITPISTSHSIDLNPGYYYTGAFSYACTLSAPLNASDKILPIYSLDGTNWTVMAGAADALSLDYDVIVLSDCTSSVTPEVQHVNLEDMQRIGAQIMTLDEIKNHS